MHTDFIIVILLINLMLGRFSHWTEPRQSSLRDVINAYGETVTSSHTTSSDMTSSYMTSLVSASPEMLSPETTSSDNIVILSDVTSSNMTPQDKTSPVTTSAKFNGERLVGTGSGRVRSADRWNVLNDPCSASLNTGFEPGTERRLPQQHTYEVRRRKTTTYLLIYFFCFYNENKNNITFYDNYTCYL